MAVPRFDNAGEAQQHYLLTQIERHLSVIRGWVMFFGVTAVLTFAVGLLAIAAAYVGSNG